MRRPLPLLAALSLLAFGCASTPHLVDGVSAGWAAGEVTAVVEIPAGTNAKFEVDKASGTLAQEVLDDGSRRVVDFLAYPGSYGLIPQTLLPEASGGDGDPLDILVLGPALERGQPVRVRPIGVLRLVDRGERDDKIIAVQLAGPLSGVHDLAELDASYPGVTAILELWFTRYKGADVLLESDGWGDAAEAAAVIDAALAAWADAR